MILSRFAYTPYGIFGRLILPGFECFTVEREWKNNEEGKSCIPEGWYIYQPSFYHEGKYQTYEILVPDRTDIKIHKANRAKELQGCIGLGMRLGTINGEWAVMNSGVAFRKFMVAMAGRVNGVIRIERYLEL